VSPESPTADFGPAGTVLLFLAVGLAVGIPVSLAAGGLTVLTAFLTRRLSNRLSAASVFLGTLISHLAILWFVTDEIGLVDRYRVVLLAAIPVMNAVIWCSLQPFSQGKPWTPGSKRQSLVNQPIK
jgi:hypothetical protein